jgi:iron uptake system component EfeO
MNVRLLVPALAAIAACDNDNDKLLDDPEGDTIAAVKVYVGDELDALSASAEAICAAAPAPDADGWDAATDAAAIDASKAAWHDARVHYERIEGAIAVLFPDLDVSTDQRYDGFLLDAGPDDDPWDGEGVTGVHAIERVLWADAIPSYVVDFESAIPGYWVAAFPADEAEATGYRDALCQRLVDDTIEMTTRFEPLALDLAAAYGGVVGSMGEQVEKVSLATSGEEESRYAQHTAADMRANLEGGRAIYETFQPWILDQDGGAAADDAVVAGFDRVVAALDAVPGDAIPSVPADWNPDAPEPDDLVTPYGELWAVVQTESDPESADSLVTAMVDAAALLGITVVP